MSPYGIHWFRRDLRVAGNPALRANFERFEGRVLGIFCFDSAFLSRPDFSHNRFAFFLETLHALQEEMREQGGDLLIVDALPSQAFPEILRLLAAHKQTKPSLVSWNRDYEPFARERDKNLEALMVAEGIEVKTERDHLIIEPHEISKTKGDEASYYQVYSPFARRWFEKFQSTEVQKRLKASHKSLAYLRSRLLGSQEKIFRLRWRDLLGEEIYQRDALHRFKAENERHVTIEIPEAGSLMGLKAIETFAGKINSYGEQRDFPSELGTSKLSLFFKNGSLTPEMAIVGLGLESLGGKGSDGATKFLKEIIWREFYYHILFHRPDVETQSFLPQYRTLQWDNREDWFEKWKNGETGYPIVDAGMRELKVTGWMHNRVRMIVASFLVKDLLIDWRWGEKYFMGMLLDGDLAPNNGGWQWAASTGCDPQPYFRIFNPILQGKKFDPEAKYIKTYVPELKDLPAKVIHDLELIPRNSKYPPPIVDHHAQKVKALALYKNATGNL